MKRVVRGSEVVESKDSIKFQPFATWLNPHEVRDFPVLSRASPNVKLLVWTRRKLWYCLKELASGAQLPDELRP